MFENKKAEKTGIHYSRYIVSWIRVGGHFFDESFEEWLKLEGLTDDEILDVLEIARTGKMGLEHSADQFMRRKYSESIEKREKEKKKVRLEVMKRIAKFARK